MEAQRHLQCIGYPVLYSPIGEPIRFRTRKHLALLVYLAIESRHIHRRDGLAGMLWPSAPLPEARHSLATGLSVLRPRVGPGVIQSTRDHVSFVHGAVTIDIDSLIERERSECEEDSDIAIAGFLEGFDIPDSREFSLWKDRIQAHLLPKLTTVFRLRVEQSRRRGDTRQIEQLATRMLALDELCEDAVRAKMEAFALTGDRLAALKLYEEWRRKMEEELSAKPSAELAALATQLRRRGWEQVTVDHLPDPSTDQRRSHAFIGRGVEYKSLYEAWESLTSYQRAHVLVLGDSGVGKTTLVDRFTAAAGLQGAAVSRVQCYDVEREIPYSAVAGLVLELLDRPEVLGTPPESLAELSRIVPKIRQRFSAVRPPKDTHGETARIEITEALHQLLEAITDVRPVILVVDDLHLADDASLSVLHLLVRRALDTRTMLIMIARPGELGLGSQARLFRDLAPSLNMRELELHPLTDGESAQLLGTLIDHIADEPPLHVKKALLASAAGYPMVLELLVQDWLAQGENALGLAVDAMTMDLGPRVSHSAAYERALSRITCSMEAANKTVLYMASILGSRVNDLPMYSLANLSLGQTMAGLGQLTELRLLRDGSRGLEFINELVRAYVYSSIPSSVRRTLHGAVADRLLSEEGTSVGSSGLEVAWHCLRAGRQEQAIPHLLSGARQAIRQGAPHVAERALKSARQTLAGIDTSAVLLLLAEAMQEQGRWRESLDVLADLPATESRDVRWWATVLTAGSRRNLGASLAEQARAEIPLLTTILRESSDPRVCVAAARTVTHFASLERDASAARALLPLVEEIPSDTLDDDTQGQLALIRALLYWLTGNVKESYLEAQQALEALHSKGVANTAAVQLTLGLGTLRMHEGKYAEALSHYHRASEMARRLGNDTQLASIFGNLAICHGRLGEYDEQLRYSSTAPRTWGAEFGGFVELQITYSHALSLIVLGRLDESQQVMNDLERRISTSAPAWMRQAWFLWKADLLLCSGKGMEAVATARKGFEGLGLELHSSGLAGPFARWLAYLGQANESYNAARTAIERLLVLLSSFDALDQVEVMCAAQSLGVCPGDHHDLAETIRERLKKLPPEVVNHLKRLGSLP